MFLRNYKSWSCHKEQKLLIVMEIIVSRSLGNSRRMYKMQGRSITWYSKALWRVWGLSPMVVLRYSRGKPDYPECCHPSRIRLATCNVRQPRLAAPSTCENTTKKLTSQIHTEFKARDVVKINFVHNIQFQMLFLTQKKKWNP